ncbi:PEP-CTERM sorting domain-containing protein [Janthinobacterium lividum]|uniref:PEP-CTERM sorting domain-containing protein n=1 Tax=Janthinobacterium TaxID=29580 RepID=UPI0008938897|nr:MULTISPECIES: PEP-CTERM sorting domain-containing protein [Janthinobacterium]MBR7635806.1 PEP-CTERM sorting domain-containing protein [Janthinobacterium lividum]OEZ66073.1 PEP-CTERM motif protein [Janthinobacterium lividum]WQE30441.1 PEP-CTERM sorting domain-containing protein [Janthinobacterium lividum]STQ95936.1 PEP-CTERM motif [Janthinobacterium lividum]
MLKPATPSKFASLFACSVLLLAASTAQAQNDAQRASGDDKRCQATGAASNAGGKAKDADLDSTYSACSLVDGFIGFGARINDGTSTPPEFGSGASDQELRNPQFGGGGHRLGNQFADAGDTAGGTRARPARDTGSYQFGTRDFVTSQEFPPIDGGAGYRGPGRAYHGATGTDTYAPLITSASRGTGSPAGGSSVGGGGATGGIDSGNSGIGVPRPPIAVVPEPETYAMLIAGLGLVAFAARRKRSVKAA